MVKKSMPHSIQIWLRDAAEQLAEAGIPSALLDAEIILSHTLRKSRTWLHAHGDETIDERELEIASARLDLRLDRTPIAYIIGHKEFYTRLFKVTPAVLIPRPESETIITLLKKYTLQSSTSQNYNSLRVVDVGTGSGCLGITAKLEIPQLIVTLVDISRHALKVAEENAETLHAEVALAKSDLLSQVTGRFDIVLANLPYVDREWEHSPETEAEPELALFAKERGLELIYRLIDELPKHMVPKGYLFLEADPAQHNAIIRRSAKHGLTHLETDDYVLVLQKN